MHTIGLGAVSLALLGAFVVRQALARNPILPLRLFGSRKLSTANAVQALMSTAFFGFFFLGSLDFERVLGYGPLSIALAFLPVAVVMGVFSVYFSAPLIGRFGPVPVLAMGQAVAAIALGMLSFGPTDASYPVHLLVPIALLGLGGGLAFPSLAIIAMADAGPADAGLASGILNTSGQVGAALGLAVLATLAGSRTVTLLHEGARTTAALAGGYHVAWLVGAGTLMVTFALAMTLRRSDFSEAVELAVDERVVA
jgi:MFS family permease